MTTVAIIDYQMGNLRSVQRAVAKAGGNPIVTNDVKTIRQADRVILPGVGAFKDAIAELRRRDLDRLIAELVNENRPLLGICLGLQMLFESSDEDGQHEGLGILPGRVVRFDLPNEYKVPHMGWNQVALSSVPSKSALPDADGSRLWEELPKTPYFYFVHSHYVQPADAAHVWLECDYGGKFCAAIQRGNLYATQFHPEKSQRDGLQLLTNFLTLDAVSPVAQ
jgi:glutamine amidotransferase